MSSLLSCAIVVHPRVFCELWRELEKKLFVKSWVQVNWKNGIRILALSKLLLSTKCLYCKRSLYSCNCTWYDHMQQVST